MPSSSSSSIPFEQQEPDFTDEDGEQISLEAPPDGKVCRFDGCSWNPEDALERNPFVHNWADLWLEHLKEEHDGEIPLPGGGTV